MSTNSDIRGGFRNAFTTVAVVCGFLAISAGAFAASAETDYGEIMMQSRSMRALGLRFTPSEITAFMAGPAVHEIETEHGTIRLLNTVLPLEDDGRWFMLVGTSMQPLDSALSGFRIRSRSCCPSAWLPGVTSPG